MSPPDAICIPPDCVPQIWPRVSYLIRSALAVGLTDFASVERRVLAGEMLLWLAWDGSKVLAAAVTQLTAESDGKVGTIVACGGSGLDCFIHLRAQLEGYFAAQGCMRSRIFGRLGWARRLPDYKTRSLVLEKEL